MFHLRQPSVSPSNIGLIQSSTSSPEHATETIYVPTPAPKYQIETVYVPTPSPQVLTETVYVPTPPPKFQTETVYVRKSLLANQVSPVAAPVSTSKRYGNTKLVSVSPQTYQGGVSSTNAPLSRFNATATRTFAPSSMSNPAHSSKYNASVVPMHGNFKYSTTQAPPYGPSSGLNTNDDENNDYRYRRNAAAAPSKCCCVVKVLAGIVIGLMLAAAIIVPLVIGLTTPGDKTTTTTSTTTSTTATDTTTTSETTTTTDTTTTTATTATTATTTTSETTTTTDTTVTTATTATTATTTTTETTTTTTSSSSTSSTSTSTTSTTTTTTTSTSTTTSTTTSTSSSTSTTSTSTSTTSSTSTTTTATLSVPITINQVVENLDPTNITSLGWTMCYNDTYNIVMNSTLLDTILDECNKDKLLLGCRPVNSTILTLAAMGLRSDVLFNCGTTTTCVHVANNVGWYFSSDYSWGFVNGTDSVYRSVCDTDLSTQGSVNSNLRLCWHTVSNLGGYRCGSTVGLNSDTNFARVIYHVD